MNALYHDLSNVDTFLDDSMLLGYSTFMEHLGTVIEVLKRLLNAGMQVNVAKCKWFQPCVAYLGFIITREGIKPQPEKIQGIHNMKRPATQKEVRHFVGMVNFYRDLYPKRANSLAPLTDKPFIVYTDASEKQIGGVVTQEDKPLGFFSCKLTDTQRRYPVTEQELLAITETLKYFKHMLYGHKIIVKTDHKNLTHQLSTHASDRVLRQQLLLEDYGAELQYIEGEKNVVADALSRLPTEEIFTFTEEDPEFPLNLATLARKQQSDTYLQAALQRDPSDYVATQQEGNKIYVLKSTQTIYVPLSPCSYSTVVSHQPTAPRY
jgi:hypothetical protein